MDSASDSSAETDDGSSDECYDEYEYDGQSARTDPDRIKKHTRIKKKMSIGQTSKVIDPISPSSVTTDSTAPTPKSKSIRQSTSRLMTPKKTPTLSKKVVKMKKEERQKIAGLKIKAAKAISMWNAERYVCELEANALGSGSDSDRPNNCLPFDGRIPSVNVMNCSFLLSKCPLEVYGQSIEDKIQRLEEGMKNKVLKPNDIKKGVKRPRKMLGQVTPPSVVTPKQNLTSEQDVLLPHAKIAKSVNPRKRRKIQRLSEEGE